MRNIPFYFIATSVVFALLGMGYGMYMAGSENHLLASAHAHNNLLGFVAMAIYGFYYRAVPQAVTGLSIVHYWVALVASILFPIGIGMAILGISPLLAAIGGGLEIVAMLIFAVTIIRHRAALAI